MTAGPPAGAISPAALASLADLLDGPLVLVDAGCRWGASKGRAALLARVEVIGFDRTTRSARV